MEHELTRFKQYLLQGKGSIKGKIVDRSPRTVVFHIETLRRFLLVYPDLSVVEIGQRLIQLKEEGRSNGYLNQCINSLRLYGRFKDTKKFEELSYFAINKNEEIKSALLTDEEIEAFLNLPPSVITRNGVAYQYIARWDMWTMFWKLFAYHLARPGGIAKLTVDDIDWGLGVLHIHDKTGKRDLLIHQAVVEDLKRYVSRLKTNKLFPAPMNENKVIDDSSWGKNFSKRIARMGLKRRNLRPYSLRHSSITRHFDNGVNPFLVMKMAGQKNLNTTLRYYHSTLKAQREAMRKDSLGRLSLSFYERKKIYREQREKLLESLANNEEEEKELRSIV